MEHKFRPEEIKFVINPLYMGVWTQKSGTTGYFFMDVRKQEGNKISGLIEDTAGRAFYEGEITPEAIKFNKQYLTECMHHDVIHYIGKKTEKGYEGEYLIDTKPTGDPIIDQIEDNGTFILEKYVPLGTLEHILNKTADRNNCRQ